LKANILLQSTTCSNYTMAKRPEVWLIYCLFSTTHGRT